MSTNVIQALKDIEKAIKAQGGGSGGSDSGDETSPEISVIDFYYEGVDNIPVISESYSYINEAGGDGIKLIVLKKSDELYYQSSEGLEEFIVGEEGDGEGEEPVTEGVPYFEFRAMPDANGIDYVRVYDDSYNYVQDFAEVKVGHYSSGPYVIECDITGSADASYPTVYPCSYTEGHEADYRGIARAISAGRDVAVLLHTNGNVSAGVDSSDVYLPLESPTPTGMDEDAYWFQRVLSHHYGQEGTGAGNLTAVNVRLDGNGPYANIYQISQS